MYQIVLGWGVVSNCIRFWRCIRGCIQNFVEFWRRRRAAGWDSGFSLGFLFLGGGGVTFFFQVKNVGWPGLARGRLESARGLCKRELYKDSFYSFYTCPSLMKILYDLDTTECLIQNQIQIICAIMEYDSGAAVL